jgi:hypothetical protein
VKNIEWYLEVAQQPRFPKAPSSPLHAPPGCIIALMHFIYIQPTMQTMKKRLFYPHTYFRDTDTSA